jgi:hypothetical protein
VQDAIDLFGLNLDPDVRTQRSKVYEEAARAAAGERWGELQRAAMRHHPHSLAARVILQRVAPERTPTAEEEMVDFVDSLWRELRVLAREIQNLRARAKPIRPVDKRQLQALGWALVVIRNDPPAGETATVDAHLGRLLAHEEAEIRKEIVALFRALAARVPGA